MRAAQKGPQNSECLSGERAQPGSGVALHGLDNDFRDAASMPLGCRWHMTGHGREGALRPWGGTEVSPGLRCDAATLALRYRRQGGSGATCETPPG
jgi:hypothetical protein